MRNKLYAPLAMLFCIVFGLFYLIFNTILPMTILPMTILPMTILPMTILPPLSTGKATQTTTIPLSVEHTLYLPLVFDKLPPPTVKFRIHLQPEISQYTSEPETVAADLAIAYEMGSRWNRISVPWNEIETAPGIYDWQIIDAVITQTVAAGFEPLATIWGAPEWTAEVDCGPIDDIASFENF